MMRMSNISMTTSVDRLKLLLTLKLNLSKHSEIVKEAREGYIKKAMREVERRLLELRKGRVVTLSFSLSPPVDHSEVYRSAIQMLEWNTEDKIELKADEFRQLVMDEWDWSRSFLVGNSLYSKTASDLVGGGEENDMYEDNA